MTRRGSNTQKYSGHELNIFVKQSRKYILAAREAFPEDANLIILLHKNHQKTSTNEDFS